VFGKWWTNATGTADTNGTWQGPVFQGSYTITVTKGARSTTRTLDIPLGLTRAGIDIILPGETK